MHGRALDFTVFRDIAHATVPMNAERFRSPFKKDTKRCEWSASFIKEPGENDV